MYFGIDDGHDAVKVVNGKPLYIPSRVISGHYPYISITSEENESCLYEIDGHKFTVLDRPSLNIDHIFLPTRTDDFPYSDLNLALVYHSLLRAGADGEVSICTGLPFSQYYVDGSKNRSLIEKKKQSFTRNVIAKNAITTPIIVEHRICSEGVAGYFDLKYNQDGSLNNEFDDFINSGVICIVDIGGRTTDIVTMDSDSISFNRSLTVDVGGMWLKDNLTTKIKAKLEVNAIPDKMIDDIIHNNGVYPRKGIDFTEELKLLKKELADKISSHIKHSVKNTTDLSLIAFIGGGSLLLVDQLRSLYPKDLAKFVKDPVHSNARGMLKLLKFGN
jgi:plasmid segregation protein ParM